MSYVGVPLTGPCSSALTLSLIRRTVLISLQGPNGPVPRKRQYTVGRYMTIAYVIS